MLTLVVLSLLGSTTDINRTPVNKTRPLNPYQLTHDTVMQAPANDIHSVAWQPTGGAVFILYSTQSSSYIYRYTLQNKRLLIYIYDISYQHLLNNFQLFSVVDVQWVKILVSLM